MTPGIRFVAILALLASIVLAMGDAFADVSAEPYVGLQGGVFLWPAYSNRDEVEADSGPGFAWAMVGGLDLESDDARALPSLPPPSRLRRLKRLPVANPSRPPLRAMYSRYWSARASRLARATRYWCWKP